MSVTTSQQINADQLQAALTAVVAGASFSSSGALLTSTGEKTITAVGATDSELQQAIAAAAGKFVDYDAARAQATANLQALVGERTALTDQLNADIAAVTNAGGWSKTPAADQDAIMGRILNGFSTVMGAIVDHLNVTGAARQ